MSQLEMKLTPQEKKALLIGVIIAAIIFGVMKIVLYYTPPLARPISN